MVTEEEIGKECIRQWGTDLKKYKAWLSTGS